MCSEAPVPPAELWTIARAAKYLDVSRQFIDRRLADGRLSRYKINGHDVRLDADEIRALVRAVPAPMGGESR